MTLFIYIAFLIARTENVPIAMYKTPEECMEYARYQNRETAAGRGTGTLVTCGRYKLQVNTLTTPR